MTALIHSLAAIGAVSLIGIYLMLVWLLAGADDDEGFDYEQERKKLLLALQQRNTGEG